MESLFLEEVTNLLQPYHVWREGVQECYTLWLKCMFVKRLFRRILLCTIDLTGLLYSFWNCSVDGQWSMKWWLGASTLLLSGGEPLGCNIKYMCWDHVLEMLWECIRAYRTQNLVLVIESKKPFVCGCTEQSTTQSSKYIDEVWVIETFAGASFWFQVLMP